MIWPPVEKYYYCDDYACIIHGDCRDVLPQLPRADLLLADPPYGNKKVLKSDGSIGGKNQAYPKKYFKFQNWNPPDKKQIELMLGCSENQIIWGGNYYANLLPNSPCWLV
jgi:site-specific DNA-methyltransferase (adenine-specific)/modification methylase